MRTSRAGCVSTILPRSCPLHFSASAAFAICGRTTSAVTTPLVPVVQAFGMPMIGITCGAVIVAWNFAERPAAAEREAFLAHVLQAPRLERLHGPVAGLLEIGDPVSRGP